MEFDYNDIFNFENKMVSENIINHYQIVELVKNLVSVIKKNVYGDVVEFGCYVGESSKYLMKLLIETKSTKKLYVYDSFDGLPDLSKWEENTGWQPRTLNTTEDVLINNFKNNDIPIPIIHKDWFIDIPDDKIPEKICFAFLDGDFYQSIYDSLVKIYDKMSHGGIIMFHDYKRHDLPGVEAAINDFFHEKGITYNITEPCEQLGMIVIGDYKENNKKEQTPITIVTGIWDIGRDKLEEGWSRSYQHYIEKFNQLLDIPYNMIIFGEKDLEEIIFKKRTQENTLFIERNKDWFKLQFFHQIQKIRNSEKWKSQAGWLKESTQSRLEMYNPLVMSKPFLLHDAKILDKFNSTHLFWLDGGITNTVNIGYFTKDRVLDKLTNIDKITFLAFPYKADKEIHGFDYKRLCEIAEGNVDKVCRGGFFGGPKDELSDFNTQYYNLMNSTLSEGLMGTEESLFTILTYRYPETYQYFKINSNGLINKFFEDLKNDNHKLLNELQEDAEEIKEPLDTTKVGLYVITFNSPNQFEKLIQSMIEYDKNFIDKPRKFLLDNSTDKKTTPKYKELCEKYGFEHIKKDNLGITGGRVFIADHFQQTDLDFYMFFEDDMLFYNGNDTVCKNGFIRKVDNLYNKLLYIIKKERFDYLKLSFTEFYGDNSIQFSWYNVPKDIRREFWPKKTKLPVRGLDPNAPKTEFTNILTQKGLAYAKGDVYLSNWPIILTKEGNYKSYIETRWEHPYEQTLMSYAFQQQKKGRINAGILLASPIEHTRFDHYDGKLRKES